ncbi:hypothetical protein HDU87_000861 [Geranomyces variabilis]|uniref:Uncharacterized protein n=1 Tax=Geranomyces variabilis TaxID=109894 RepID=A0AAD5TDI5_9FUNG|nr:hypothetical protein HDU87_000861 [Geranomyces variabilis]
MNTPLSAQVPAGFPAAVPAIPAFPTALPAGLPAVLPTALPARLPTVLPTALPAGFPTALPSALSAIIPSPAAAATSSSTAAPIVAASPTASSVAKPADTVNGSFNCDREQTRQLVAKCICGNILSVKDDFVMAQAQCPFPDSEKTRGLEALTNCEVENFAAAAYEIGGFVDTGDKRWMASQPGAAGGASSGAAKMSTFSLVAGAGFAAGSFFLA